MLYESGEDYLETILLLQKEIGDVRSIDIASKLGYSKPSISRAMGNLKKDGYIDISTKGYIIFTEKGLECANMIYTRHLVITNFLIKTLDLDAKIAEEDACKIEHIINLKTFEKMKLFIAK